MSTPANQPFLDAAADDARRAAGDSYYTGCRIHTDSNTVELYLASAPRQLLEHIEALHPGVYVIHNDAPRPLGAVEEVRKLINFAALRREGIAIISHGPTVDGYLRVGVMRDVGSAQATLDAMFGPNLIRVHEDDIKIGFAAGAAVT